MSGLRVAAFAFAVIAATNVSAAPQTATINGAPISYEICGDEKAPGVVLLHDGLANAALWDAAWPGLCAHYRVVRYDRRGYGRSPPAKEFHAPVDDLAGLMNHVGFEHAHLIGAFTGAGIALDFVIDYPEMADRLVLVTPNASGFRVSESMISRMQGLEEHIRKGDIEATASAMAADPYFLAPHSTAAREKLAEIIKASPGDLGEHPRQRRRGDTAQHLSEIYAPTLIVVGATDDPFNHAVAAAIQKGLRNAQSQMVLDAGHLLYLEAPDSFLKLVLDFLK
ncbi:MAG: alpha/beta fold hydrolase [Rhodospirillaceae bacterium]